MTPAPGKSIEVEVEGRLLKLSNLDKVLYPATGFTKGQVIDYYTRIAPALLSHLRQRALTLKRYPNGVDAQFFYEKNCPKHRPPWVNTVTVYSSHNKATMDYCVVDDLASVVWVANLASLELHTSLAACTKVEQPTALVFDLDPGAPATVVECARVGIWLRDILRQLGLECFPKTSGSKGLQIFAPLNTNGVTYDDTKPFAHALARLLESEHPDLVVSSMAKDLRKGKVLIDWSQNDFSKTTVCAYSLRARERPTVSAPLAWDEAERLADTGEIEPVTLDADAVLERVERDGDLFAPVAEMQQTLPRPPQI